MSSKLIFSALVATLSFSSMGSAATVTYDLTSTVASGPGLGLSTTGSVSFDDSYLVTGDETLAPLRQGGVTLTYGLATGGTTVWFTQDKDSDYPTYPKLTFVDFALKSINFRLLHKVNGVNLAKFGVLEVLFGNTLRGDARTGFEVDAYVRPVNPAPVPLPAGLPLMAAALGGLVCAARRRAKPSEALI